MFFGTGSAKRNTQMTRGSKEILLEWVYINPIDPRTSRGLVISFWMPTSLG